MRSGLLRILGAALLVLAVVWALVLGWWQSNNHQPAREELALFLGALPLVLLGGYWLLWMLIEQFKVKPVGESVVASMAADDDQMSILPATMAAAERRFTLQVIDSFVVAPGGSSGDAILAAVDSGQRPDPVPELLDSAGFPVFAAMVGDIDVASMSEALAERHPSLAHLRDGEDAWRALTLLDAVLAQARETILALPGLFPSQHLLHLQVRCLLPAAWGSNSFPALRAWLGSLDWPQAENLVLELELVPVASEGAAMLQVDEAILRANRNPSADHLILVAAAASAAVQSSVDAWAAAGSLFSSQYQERQIPGEGGVALLLAPAVTCARLQIADSVAISRLNLGCRDKSLRTAGRVGGALIAQLVAGTLEVKGIAATEVAAAVLDTDHRAAYLTEMLEGLGVALAHLDPMQDCPATGTVNGAVPPLGGLIALVCACAKVLAVQAPVLCLSNQAEKERMVLLAMPAALAADPESRCT